jgi:predicted flap endonuclease-1-like 5' DNA nuclease
MSLLDTIKSALGLGERTAADRSEGGSTEPPSGSQPRAAESSPGPAAEGRAAPEPDAASERAVKTDTEPAAERGSAAGEPDVASSAASDAGPSAAESVDPGEVSATAESDDSTAPDEESTADAPPTDTTEINGIGAAYADRLAEAGITSVADLAAADAEALAAETDLAAGRIEGWIEQAQARSA